VAEVKGDSDNVDFDGNWGAYNSGGIQFWDEGDTEHSFNNTKIQNNQMSNFVNADQDGLLALDDGASRHKSGIVGGVVFQVKDDDASASTNLVIKGNEIYGDISQILNDDDLDALIEIGGEVTGVAIDGNTLKWLGSVSASEKVTGSVVNQGIHLYGDVNGGTGTLPIVIKNNIFDTSTTSIGSNYESSAIFLNTDNLSDLDLGTLSSDIDIFDESSATYGIWVSSSDVGNYDNAHAGILVIGQSGSVYGTVNGDSGLTYADTDYSAIM
jgi:hypothetical protein